ncbi:MAG: hypothetical protein JF571_06290 [Asticcacaulis sp.]|nr:hypothetical protein [Asticcacaulis sp.]
MPLQRQSVHDSYMPPKPAHLVWYGDAREVPPEPKPAAPAPPPATPTN